MSKQKKSILITFNLFLCCNLFSQTISGNLKQLTSGPIILEGFNGFKTYIISKTSTDEKGNFKLTYSKSDYGVGYLMSTDEKPLFIILSGEDIKIVGESFSNIETIKTIKGQENQWFEQYAKEHPRREQALNAWIYLEKLYALDSLFTFHKAPNQAIQKEKQRIKAEDQAFISKLPKDSYVRWLIPTRKLVSSVSSIAKFRPEEIQATIDSFRVMDYTDSRLYKSSLFKDAIDGHFWLLENSGKTLDSVFLEMKISIDAMLENLVKDNNKLNEVTNYLFNLLERHSLYQASEYLALKILNETSCTIDSNLAKQLENYRAMKIGNIAPDINFNNNTYFNGVKQTMFNSLNKLPKPYTLLVFGASWCPKCIEELPKIIQNYDKWRNIGMEVVYVSLDTEKQIFEQAVKSYPFYVYCDFMKWESQVVQDYYVFATPTFYLINNNQEITLRPTSIEQVNAWVDWVLVKGN